jgi:fermentation-respiration switch protein FrsA (DUF1100 family)
MAKALLLCLMAIAGLYIAAAVLLFLAQRSMIYPAPAGRAAEKEALGDFERVTLRTSEGLRLVAIYRPARGDLPTIVFFHGNGDSIQGARLATELLASDGYGLLLPEYRGYGGNPGSPSETGLYRDGEAALQWLADQHISLERTVLIGNSLGSGVATDLAARHAVAGLVLISGFTSMADVAALHMRLFPVRLLLQDRYDNRSKLPRVTAPVLILHGSDDTLIPASHGVELAAARKGASLVILPEVGHELAYTPQSQAAILEWLRLRPHEGPAGGS